MMNFKNLRVRTKIILGIGVPLVLAAVLGVISITNIRTMVKSEKWVEHTYNVIGDAEQTIASAVDMETGMRGYLLAGKEDFLDPYQKGEEATYEQIKSLQQTVSDNPAQVERLAEVENILREWQEKVTEPTIELRREVGDAETMNDMAALVKEARGKVYFDKFRNQIATFIAREESLVAERQKAVEDATVENETNAQLITETAVWVDHTFRVMATANEILAAAVDMETGMRGFLLAGKEEFLEPYNAGQEKFNALVASLSKTVDDNPAQVELLGEVKATIAEWQEQVTEPAIALRRNVGFGTETTMDDVATLVGQAKGKTYVDTFRSQIATFIAREEELIAQRQKAAEETTAAAAANRKLISEATAWVEHTQQVIEKANQILATAVDMETGMRGYLLAGKEEFLEPYNAGHEQFTELVASLSKTVDDNPAQLELLGESKTTIEEWQAQVMDPQIELRRKIGDAKTMDDMADLVGEARGKQYFDRFRGVMDDFVGEEEALMEQRQAANASMVNTTITSIVAGVSAAVIIGLFVGFFIIRSIVRPLNEAVALNNKLSEGDLNLEIQVRSKDEIGQLQTAMLQMVQRLKEVVTNVKGAADNVASGSQQMSSSSEEMSNGATEQAAAAEEASSSMEEMAANIRQNTDNALQTEKIAVKAAEDARAGGKAVTEAVEAMREIAGKIMIIEDITRQTRMLSLNATIEAARAQEHGRGFAVVASEVRSLAERSQQAATEINQLASSSVAISEKAGEMLQKLVPDIQKTAELVQEITAASKEQNTGAGQINKAIQQLDNVTQQNSATSEELSATAEELSSQAEMLQHTIDFFKTEEADQRTLNYGKYGYDADRARPGAVTRAKAAHIPVTDRKENEESTKKGNGKPGGPVFEMGQKEVEGDERDAEFERF